jgi:hypothetical protein
LTFGARLVANRIPPSASRKLGRPELRYEIDVTQQAGRWQIGAIEMRPNG